MVFNAAAPKEVLGVEISPDDITILKIKLRISRLLEYDN